ncbi:hypothetical protein ACWDUM_09225 [Rhodococcus sp. NPDC003322]
MGHTGGESLWPKLGSTTSIASPRGSTPKPRKLRVDGVETHIVSSRVYAETEGPSTGLRTRPRLGFHELGSRLRERGHLTGELDHFFLAQLKLFDLLDGAFSQRLVDAKIKGRRAAFDRFDRREISPDYFLMDGEPWADPAAIEAAAPDDSDGVLQGIGSSRGVAVGTARVIRDLKEIGRVQEGDILVTNSTDPAWTPVPSA